MSPEVEENEHCRDCRPSGRFGRRCVSGNPGAVGYPDIFGGQVTAKKVNGVWVAAVPKILDGLEIEERKAIFHASQFIAKYRYVIGVLNGDGVAVDDSHAGIHTC